MQLVLEGGGLVDPHIGYLKNNANIYAKNYENEIFHVYFTTIASNI